MQNKPKSLNFQVLLEILCYLIFGGLIIYLIYSEKYLIYVAPRMKPYLYFTAIIMLIWAITGLSRIFRPKYKIRSSHCFVIALPILVLLLPHEPVNTAELSANYSSGNALIQSAVIDNKSKSKEESNEKLDSIDDNEELIDNNNYEENNSKEENNKYIKNNEDDYEIDNNVTENNYESDNNSYENNKDSNNEIVYNNYNKDSNNYNGNETLEDNNYNFENSYNNQGQNSYDVVEEKNNNITEKTIDTEENSNNLIIENNVELSGLDIENKKIIVSNDEFYQWIIELYTNMYKYEGYTITMTGFIFKDPQFLAEDEFVPARLALTCCTADLAPMGMICKYDKVSELEENSWVTVEGTIYIGKYEERDEPQISVTKITPAEEVEGYIYPF